MAQMMAKRSFLKLSCCLALVAAVVVGATTVGFIATSSASSPSPTLRPDKQAVVDHMYTLLHPANVVTVAPDPAAVPSLQPCMRDPSQLTTGITQPRDGSDRSAWNAYTLNNEWIAPDGSVAVQAGKVTNTTQGVLTVERWSPPITCLPTATVILAPPTSGSLTVIATSATTVSLSSSAGTAWTLDLSNLMLTES